MTEKIIQECADMVQELAGNDILYLQEAIEVQMTPHTPGPSIWALSVSPQQVLFLMDEEEQWNALEAGDRNAMVMAGSIYQRLRWMRNRYAKAS